MTRSAVNSMPLVLPCMPMLPRVRTGLSQFARSAISVASHGKLRAVLGSLCSRPQRTADDTLFRGRTWAIERELSDGAGAAIVLNDRGLAGQRCLGERLESVLAKRAGQDGSVFLRGARVDRNTNHLIYSDSRQDERSEDRGAIASLATVRRVA